MIRRNSGKQPSNRAVGYVRRSTDRQEHSISDQKKVIEEYAANNGFKLLKFYTDDAISGTSTIKRKAFLQMIGDAEADNCQFNKIIVYDVKRFGRTDNDEAGFYRHKLKMRGVEVLYVTENFNGNSTDDLLRPVKQWQARQESKDLSKVTIRGLLSKSGTGCWMGGVPPHGYDLRYENCKGEFLLILRYMPDGSKEVLDENGKTVRTLARGESLSISKRDYAKLTLSDSQRVEIVKRIFHMYAEQGKGYRSVADTLNRQSTPTPRGPEWSHIYSGKWTDTTIRAILVNPIYVGDMVWNRRRDGRFHRISKGQAVDRESVHGARLVPNQKEDWIIVRDAHPPLISRRLFEQTRQRLENHPKSIEQRQRSSRLNTHGRTWNGQRSRFILSGLMRCSLCGNRYQGVTRTKVKRRLDGTRVKTFYYACGGYITKGRSICEMNAIGQKVLEETVIKMILDFYKPLLDKGGRKKLAEAIKNQIGSEAEEFIAARKRAQRQLNKINKTINNLLDNITSINRELVDQRLTELKQQKHQFETRLEELDRLVVSQAEIKNMVADAMQFISSLEFTLSEGLAQEKLVALRRCIEKISINKPAGTVKLKVRSVPVGNIEGTKEYQASL
jgi:DNA invertase Pin-like site-specific DNA recombinase